MTTLTTYTTKGATLTKAEADANFDKAAQTKATNYTCLEGDNRDTIEASAAINFTLPIAATIAAATDTGDYEVTLKNNHTANCTIISQSTNTIDGSTDDLTLCPGHSETLKVNASSNGYNTRSTGRIYAPGETVTTSGATVSLTDIPTWATSICLAFNGVSTAGVDNISIKLGDAGGIESSGYDWNYTESRAGVIYSFGNTSDTDIQLANITNIAQEVSGLIEIINIAGNEWQFIFNLNAPAHGGLWVGGGNKTLSQSLTQLQINAGSSTFDAGSIRPIYRG